MKETIMISYLFFVPKKLTTEAQSLRS